VPTRAWIDVYAKQNIKLINDNVGPYAVHANAGSTEGDFGGLITIKAQLGTFVATGATGTSPSFAVQANAVQQSGHGGNVTSQAGANVELNASTVEAKGAAGGSNRTGGTIDGRSFNGSLLGNAPGVLDANAGAPVIGAITLTACGSVNYTGTTLPTPTTAAGVCGREARVATGRPAGPHGVGAGRGGRAVLG